MCDARRTCLGLDVLGEEEIGGEDRGHGGRGGIVAAEAFVNSGGGSAPNRSAIHATLYGLAGCSRTGWISRAPSFDRG